MKTTVIYTIAFFILCLTGMKCEKSQEQAKEALPEATQEGKNTFGFLLNGDVWVPKAKILTQKLDLSYDPGYKGGSLSIIAYRYEKDFSQYISMGNTEISKIGEYDLFVYFDDDKTKCTYTVNGLMPVGKLIITKLDLSKKFISGTFSFKLEKTGCPTINATEGRFDLPIE